MAEGSERSGSVVRFVQLAQSIPARMKRNPELLRAIQHLAFPKSQSERDSAIKDLNVWLHRKQIEAETALADKAIKGFPTRVLSAHPDIEQHARQVLHLGSLAPLAPLPASRWDYCRLLLQTLLELKQRQPGLGLGSVFLVNGNELTGLEIAQTWTLLGGYGHLFGTFATERALLYAFDSDADAAREFTLNLAPEVRSEAEVVFRQRDMYRFFYILSAWRVSQWKASPVRLTCLHLLARLLNCPDDVRWRRLMWAFRRARQITYTRLHAMLGIEIASVPIPISVAVRDLRPISQIAFLSEESEPVGTVAALVDALDRFYNESFFTSPAASERVLAHLREFKAWWQFTTSDVSEKLVALRRRPSDWPDTPPQQREHFARLFVPDGGIGWMTEVRAWLAEGTATWDAGNFLFTPTRRRESECNVIDIYTGGQPSPKLVFHVAQLLAERNEAMWTASRQGDLATALWRSIANYCLRLFQLMLKPGCTGQLEPVPADDGIGLAIAARSVKAGCGRLADFARRVRDDDRRRELDALHQAASRHIDRDCVWLAFLGRLRILDVESGRQRQELDGVYALVTDGAVEWHFVEHKDGNASGMRGQLDELGAHLTATVPPADFLALARGKAAHTHVKWP